MFEFFEESDEIFLDLYKDCSCERGDVYFPPDLQFMDTTMMQPNVTKSMKSVIYQIFIRHIHQTGKTIITFSHE